MGMMNRRSGCREYEAFLEDFSSGTAGETMHKRIEQHLRECPDCAYQVEAAVSIGRILRFANEPVGDPGPFFTRRVMAAVRSENDRESASVTSFWKPLEILSFRAAWTAAAALAVLLTYGAVSQRNSQSLQSPVAQVRSADSFVLFPDPGGPQSLQDDALMPIVDANNGK
jgi:anti-sigma factor RsiW